MLKVSTTHAFEILPLTGLTYNLGQQQRWTAYVYQSYLLGVALVSNGRGYRN